MSTTCGLFGHKVSTFSDVAENVAGGGKLKFFETAGVTHSCRTEPSLLQFQLDFSIDSGSVDRKHPPEDEIFVSRGNKAAVKCIGNFRCL